VVEWGRARGRAETWPDGRRGPAIQWPVRWPAHAPRLTELVKARVAAWLAADTAPGRLMPWLPIAFGFGVVGYFVAEREPAWWAGGAAFLSCAALAVIARRRPVAFPLILAFCAIAAGFAAATLRTRMLAHPILSGPVYSASITGFVEVREERERTDRIVVRVRTIDGDRLGQALDRVRLSVRKGTAPAVGSYISVKARLNPPLQPLRPGGYDFARDLYFHGIGASGFVSGTVKVEPAPEPPGLALRLSAAIERVRDAIDERIRVTVKGDAGAIASALITGKRDAISAPVNDAMYVSSLAHVLSISGYHMAVVAGVVFFVIRASLALVPGLATRRPIKKWAAGVAFVAAALYLFLSGAEVATQRAFIMTAIVLVGVMADRPALTLRTLAVAALGVMLLSPESVVHPSFQMSFAATLALIAVYERGLPRIGGRETSLGARAALWGVNELVALVLASLVAGLATTPYAAFHFHRLAPYGVLANLAAMPVVSGWVMPLGLLALIVLPFGYDAPLWQLMALGIDWMTAVALWVAQLPGAVGRVAAFGPGPLLVGTAGLVMICLLRTPLRVLGAVLVLGASVLAVTTPQPDVMVAGSGDAFAVRGPDGRLQLLKTGSDTFSLREWLAADGDARQPGTAAGQGFACDDAGCVAKLADGKLVAIATAPAALTEDCRRAALVITTRQRPPACIAPLIDRDMWRQGGALALRRMGEHWEITATRSPAQDRPWVPAAIGGSSERSRTPTADRTAPRDATPRPEALEADD
jgi:competence protein ComEC